VTFSKQLNNNKSGKVITRAKW